MKTVVYMIGVLHCTILLEANQETNAHLYSKDEQIRRYNTAQRLKRNADDYNVGDRKRYKAEIQHAYMADSGVNRHKYVPPLYKDVGRRFVLQYPYSEELQKGKGLTNEEDKLIPMKAPPEVVLAIAKESAKIEKSKPIVRTHQFLKNNILRSGNYWDDVWIEEGEPNKLLRSHGTRLNVVRIKIMPGSNLHDIVSAAKQISPKLLYIINKRDEK